jgi:hypothetical protein
MTNAIAAVWRTLDQEAARIQVHVNVTETLETYSHALPDMQRTRRRSANETRSGSSDRTSKYKVPFTIS